MHEFQMLQERDRSIIIKCIKCQTNLARIEIKSMFRLGFYICESCFGKLDKPISKEKEKQYD